jgi:hypothetical protein
MLAQGRPRFQFSKYAMRLGVAMAASVLLTSVPQLEMHPLVPAEDVPGALSFALAFLSDFLWQIQ